MKRSILLLGLFCILTHYSYSQLTREVDFGTVRATCSDGIYIDLHNFTVKVTVKGYMPGAPMGMFANDFTAEFITTFEVDNIFYDSNGNKASFDEIEGVSQTKIKIGYINVEIVNFSNTLLFGKFNSGDTPYTSLMKGRSQTFNPYEWDDVLNTNEWKSIIEKDGKEFSLDIEKPEIELTHYHTNVKFYFDQLIKKQQELKKIDALLSEANELSYSNDINDLNTALDLYYQVLENKDIPENQVSKLSQNIFSLKFRIKTISDSEKQTSDLSDEEENSTIEKTSQESKQESSYKSSDRATKAAESYLTCKELYRQGHLEAAKRCFEGHKAAYGCWDCDDYIRKINEQQLGQAAGQVAGAAVGLWVAFAEMADHFTLYLAYNNSIERGEQGVELQIAPVYTILYWSFNFTYLQKRQYNFPFMYNDYVINNYWGVGTSAGFHFHLFSVKRKKHSEDRRVFSIQTRFGYGIYYGWLGTEPSFEYFPEAYISLNNIVGIGAKYISSSDGWANHDDYLGSPTFIDNMDKNKYFKGLRYSIFINFGDIF